MLTRNPMKKKKKPNKKKSRTSRTSPRGHESLSNQRKSRNTKQRKQIKGRCKSQSPTVSGQGRGGKVKRKELLISRFRLLLLLNGGINKSDFFCFFVIADIGN